MQYGPNSSAQVLVDTESNRPNYDGTFLITMENRRKRHRLYRIRSGFLGWRKSIDSALEEEFELEGAKVELRGDLVMVEPRVKTKMGFYRMWCDSLPEATMLFKKLRQNAEPHHVIRLPTAFEEQLPNGPHTWWNAPGIVAEVSSGLDSAKAMVDGSWQNSECWTAERGDKEQWVVFDLGRPAEVCQFKCFSTEGLDCPRECTLLFSDRNDHWAKWCVASRWYGQRVWGWSSPPITFDSRLARFWKLVIKNTFDEKAPVQLMQVIDMVRRVAHELLVL